MIFDRSGQGRIIGQMIDKGPTLAVDFESLLNGTEFNAMVRCFDHMIHYKGNAEEVSGGIDELKSSLLRTFKIKTDIKLVDSSPEYNFFGFRFYPTPKTMARIANEIVGDTKGDHIRDIWKSESMWFIEMDSKILYDLSAKFNAIDLTMLFLYRLESTIMNYPLVKKISVVVKEQLTGIDDTRVREFATNKSVVRLYSLPFLYVMAEPNYTMDPLEDSLVCYDQRTIDKYKSAVGKVFTRYGMDKLIDRQEVDITNMIVYVTNWIFEGINDLKYAVNRFRKNILTKIEVSNSPYISSYLKDIYSFFSSLDAHHAPAMEATIVREPTKERAELQNLALEGFWKKKFYDATSDKLKPEYLDKNGFAIKVDQHDLDEIKVEIDTIQTADDKLYLLNKLYKLIMCVDNALDLLEDPKLQSRVKQTKNELINKRDQLQDIRKLILHAPIGREQYGLYVKYPVGYEG